MSHAPISRYLSPPPTQPKRLADFVSPRVEYFGAPTVEGKALPTTAIEVQSGDLILDGYAVVWSGLDAQQENFVRGSVKAAAATYLNGSAPLCVNHKSDTVIGRVLELEEDSYGVRIKARVNRVAPGEPGWATFDLIRRQNLKGFSIGGIFSRVFTGGRRMIGRVERLLEVSLSATPSHPMTGVRHLAEAKAISPLRVAT